MPALTAARLDAWLSDPAIRTHHRRAAAAGPEALWSAARSVRLSDTRSLGRLVRWRIPGTPRDQPFHELLSRYPFTLLEEEDDGWYAVSGLCGRIWTLTRDYPRLAGPEEFAAWREPGTVRVLFAHWVEAGDDGTVDLVSEARVAPTDGAAARRLRALWTVIGPFERLIGSEPLAVAGRRAEAGSG
jgi:hypothetical protein